MGSATVASVLLLEAEPVDAGRVLAALAEFRSRFRTEWVVNLRCAVEALVERDFDCLIVGLGLPEAQGLEIVEVLRGASDEAAVIVLADREDALLGFRAIQGGVDEYFVRSELATRDPRDLCLSVQYAIERARLTAGLRAAEANARSLSAIVESTADAILTKSAKGLIRTWNHGAELLYGYRADEVIGRHVDLLHPWDEKESTQILSSVEEGQTMRGLETVHRTKSADLVHVSLTVSPLVGPHREHLGASVIARDISDRRLLEEELTKQAMHDGLTGLPNRALLTDRLQQALADAERSRNPVAVLFLDLDNFKQVNDSRGHQAGDHLLVEVAGKIARVVRPSDTVARLGGDEFVVVCRNADSRVAEDIAGRVREALGETVLIDGDAVEVTASLGIAVAPPVEARADLMLEYADTAMYEAKARGGNRIQLFDPAFVGHSDRRLKLVDELREALQSDALEVHYQPMVDMASGRITGVEALARWNHPVRGSVPPGLFVPLAEETGLIAQLDTWVLQNACRDAVWLRDAGVLPADARMAVNLSARTVGDRHLGALVHGVTAAQRLRPDALVVEVTETAVLQDPAGARSSLESLRILGVGVALDDFGTGYSSLTYLRQLPVSHLKIDRSFVANITREADDRAITGCVVDLARKLGIQVVAEGVETLEQNTVLRRLGCGTGQGYLWSRAVPREDLAGLRLRPAKPLGPPAQGTPGRGGSRRRRTPVAEA